MTRNDDEMDDLFEDSVTLALKRYWLNERKKREKHETEMEPRHLCCIPNSKG